MAKVNETIIQDYLYKPKYDDNKKREVFKTAIYELDFQNDNAENLTAFWGLYNDVKDSLPMSSSNEINVFTEVNNYQQLVNDSIDGSSGEIKVWNDGTVFYSFNNIGERMAELEQFKSLYPDLYDTNKVIIPNNGFEVWEDSLPKFWIPSVERSVFRTDGYESGYAVRLLRTTANEQEPNRLTTSSSLQLNIDKSYRLSGRYRTNRGDLSFNIWVGDARGATFNNGWNYSWFNEIEIIGSTEWQEWSMDITETIVNSFEYPGIEAIIKLSAGTLNNGIANEDWVEFDGMLMEEFGDIVTQLTVDGALDYPHITSFNNSIVVHGSGEYTTEYMMSEIKWNGVAYANGYLSTTYVSSNGVDYIEEVQENIESTTYQRTGYFNEYVAVVLNSKNEIGDISEISNIVRFNTFDEGSDYESQTFENGEIPFNIIESPGSEIVEQSTVEFISPQSTTYIFEDIVKNNVIPVSWNMVVGANKYTIDCKVSIILALVPLPLETFLETIIDLQRPHYNISVLPPEHSKYKYEVKVKALDVENNLIDESEISFYVNNNFGLLT